MEDSRYWRATGSKAAGGHQHFLEVLGCVTNRVGAVQAGGWCTVVKEDGLWNEMGFWPSLVRLASASETLDCFICEIG